MSVEKCTFVLGLYLYIIHSLEHLVLLMCFLVMKNFENLYLFIPWNAISKNAINIFGVIEN